MKNNIKKLRKDRGLTLEQLSEKVGISHVSVQRHENGTRDINSKMLEKYAVALECHPSEILGNTLRPDQEAILAAYEGLSEGAKEMFAHMLSTLPAVTAQKQSPKSNERKSK